VDADAEVIWMRRGRAEQETWGRRGDAGIVHGRGIANRRRDGEAVPVGHVM
jgi:hypothetical protein